MDGQWAHQFYANGHGRASTTLHCTFPPISVIAQVSLATRYDYDASEQLPDPPPVPPGDPFGDPVFVPQSAAATLYWTSMRLAGKSYDEQVGPNAHVIMANGLVEATAQLWARHCWAGAIANVFIWPEVAPTHWHSGPTTATEDLLDALWGPKHRTVFLHDDPGHKLRHLHTVVNFPGGREVSEEEAISTARAHALRLGHPAADLGHAVSTDPAHGRHPHRIDPATGEFVALPHPGLDLPPT